MNIFKLLKNVKIINSLKKIYGIKNYNIQIICKKNGFSLNLKLNQIADEHYVDFVNFLKTLNILINEELKKFKFSIFKNLIVINNLKIIKFLKGLPIKGQKTRRNAKTAKKIVKRFNVYKNKVLVSLSGSCPECYMFDSYCF